MAEWYKRYPADFIHGTMGLSLEEKGAYSLCLDLIYVRGEPIPDDPRWLAGVCGVSIRKWNSLRRRLIEVGKLHEIDGFLDNDRAKKENENYAKSARNLAESGAKGGRKRAENEANANKFNDITQANLKHLEENRIEEKEEEIKPNGFIVENLGKITFGEFWKKWAAHKTAKGPKKTAEAQWDVKVWKDGVDPAMVMAQAAAYCDECQRTDTNTAHVFRWLRDLRWTDERIPAARRPESLGAIAG